MKKFRLGAGARVVASLAAATGALAIGNFATSTAGADPAWSPSATPFVAVGSNTIEDIGDAYSGVAPTPGLAGGHFNSYTPLRDPTTFKQVYSWDAVNPFTNAADCISAKPGFPAMARPNGSGNGLKALSDSIAGVSWSAASAPGCAATSITGEIDLSRSSSAPSGGNCTFAGANCLAWIDFGHDAVSYAYYGPGATTSKIDHLTTGQLNAIYTSSTGTYTDPATSVTYHACLPQLGSGTEKFFVGKIGTTTAIAEAAATAANCAGFEENGANTFQSTAAAIPLPAGDVAVVPFSVGSYISQANQVAVDRSSAGVTAGVGFGVIDGSAGQLPYAGSGTSLSPDTTYYGGNYGRDLYLVIDNKKLNGAAGTFSTVARRIFGYLGTNYAIGGGPQSNGTTGGGAICQAPYQTTTLNTFGFLAPTAGCGAETLTLLTTGTGS